jgi:hypothetical protein
MDVLRQKLKKNQLLFRRVSFVLNPLVLISVLNFSINIIIGR